MHQERLEEILNIEGIVIRRIPKESVHLYNYNDYNKRLLGRANTEKIYSESLKRDMIKEVELNSLGEKYIVTIASNQDSQVHFSLKNSGVGNTIELAYSDYLAKTKRGGIRT